MDMRGARTESSKDYTEDEENASKAEDGVWQGQFIKLWV